MAQGAFFMIAAIGAVAGAIGVVAFRNAFYSVLALVCHLLFLATLFMLLRAQFVAAAQVIVYAGAVMVLYVFVVSYVAEASVGPAVTGAGRGLAYLFAAMLATELMIAMLGSGLSGIGHDGANLAPVYGSPSQIGRLLLTGFLFPFEAASILLLIAAVGAVVLARRRGGIVDEPGRPVLSVMDIVRDERLGTMAESINTERRPAIAATAPLGQGQDPRAETAPPAEREGGW